ncbi:MAG: efflux RND transporter permease subunit [Nitrospirota bacterium]|jgi:HAE1 family hydrophobic/amphiphilic exporter-1
MDVVRFSITKPVTIVVGVILVVLFGLIGLMRMPYQLSPSVVEPEITVTTVWRGATPYEVEREIIEEQEEALKGIPGLAEMESESSNGMGTVTLRFRVGTDVDDALLRVSNKLNEVPRYPDAAEKPVINATGAATSPVVWMLLKSVEGNPRPVETYFSFFENEVRQHLERVEGVADLFVRGGIEKEMHIIVNPERLAAYGLTINDVIEVLGAENVNVSAGNLGVSRRDYRIRTTGEFTSPEEIEGVVLRSTGQRRIRVRDVATVKFGYEKRRDKVMHNSEGGIAVGVKPEPGTNVLTLTDRTREVVDRLNKEVLLPQGIFLDWVYDQRPYIRGAIDLIQQNILVGGILAVLVLLLFLQSARATVVVATAIPISIIGTFIFMQMLGRNLNVVSLAGIAFAVGMLVDNAIVVIENIDRHRKMGKSAFSAAYDGTREVWGAVLASTATTVAVFLPVVFIQEEAGQLFRDIAIAVVSAVTLSLFVSVLVIPMLSRKIFGLTRGGKRGRKVPRKGGVLSAVGGKARGLVMAAVAATTKNWATRVVTVLSLTGLAVAVVVFLIPPMEYLPQGNRNLIINYMVPPPGLSYAEREQIGEHLFEQVEPYIGQDRDGLPAIENMFYVGSEGFMIFGATSKRIDRAADLIPLFTRMIYSVPGMFGVSLQAGIFQTRLGQGRTIDVDISGKNLNNIVQSAQVLFGKIKAEGIEQIRPVPTMEVLYPEVRLVPRRDRLRSNGMSTRDLGVALDVLMDGRDVGEFKQPGEKKIDMVLLTTEEDVSTPEALFSSLVVTPGGKVVPVSSLADMQRTTGITQIRHLERNRTVTLEVTPPKTMPLESAMNSIKTRIVPGLKQAGMLGGVDIKLGGAADKLDVTRRALQWNFVLAAMIAYLLMAALFGNFVYPLVIMFTVPLAGAGGFVGLTILNLFVSQPLDVVTMLGFVILVGIVVNNAILIVHQALNNIRYHGMGHREAVLESTRSRLRPIYMSASTSIFGMLPLVVFPGAGSELYRGLGSVILGGIAVSTVFTVFIIPSLLLFVIRMEKVPTRKEPDGRTEEVAREAQPEEKAVSLREGGTS